MSVIFAPLKGGGFVNLAHVVYIDKDGLARMDNGPILHLAENWSRPGDQMAFTGTEDVSGLDPLVYAIRDLEKEIFQVRINR